MKALISGAGVAGPTLAFWLVRHGWQVTLVERAAGLRSGGNPVDVRGPAVAVAERMGILPRLRAAATHASAMRVLDPRGRPIARIAMPSRGGEVEIPRSDLATILAGAVRDDAELILDDTITAMRQEPGGVEVTFEKAAPRRFDLVIGADGLHSTVRRLAFGPESRFVRPIGLGVATVPLGEPAENPDEVLLFNTPGRLVSIHPARGSAVAAFIFRSERISREGLAAAYARSGWRVPALLKLAVGSDELFLDPVSRVSLPRWSSGRVTLLGDAASSLSLLGDGSTLAMTAAHTLAQALAGSPGRLEEALRGYETEHRKLVMPKQRRVGLAAGMLVPATRLGLTTRNVAARWMGRAA